MFMDFANILNELILLCRDEDPGWATSEFIFGNQDAKYKVKLKYINFTDHKEIYVESMQRL